MPAPKHNDPIIRRKHLRAARRLAKQYIETLTPLPDDMEYVYSKDSLKRLFDMFKGYYIRP